MRASLALKFGMVIAGAMLSGTAFAQAPAAAAPAQGPGSGLGSGFGDHRPPFERAMGGMGEHGRWWNNQKAIDRLKLTDTQRKAMDDTLQQHRETLIDLHAGLDRAELELEPMMKEDQPNESQILAQIDKVAQARAELEKANARFLLAIRSKLSPEQWKQMEADRASRPHGEWNRNGGPGADGQPHGNWQRHGQTPPPPSGPQSMMESPDGPPAPPQGTGAAQ
jgi:periplasmic protein CpxP/Spy